MIPSTSLYNNPITLGATSAASGTAAASPLAQNPTSTQTPATLQSSNLASQNDNSMQQMMMQLVQMVLMLVTSLMGQGGNQASQPAFDLDKGLPAKQQAGKGGGAVPDNQGPTGLSQQTSEAGNVNNDAQVKDLMNTVSKSSEGKKLLDTAIANGYKIKIGTPDADADSGQIVNGSTDPNTKTITINPNAPDKIKTLAHELTHANANIAAPNHQDSQAEEKNAEYNGYLVKAQAQGRNSLSATEMQAVQDKPLNYQNLGGDTTANGGIRNILQGLGIATVA